MEVIRKFRRTGWLKSLGVATFFIFLAKGLLWLIVPALLIKGCAAD